jgi:hypothetical protein
VRTGEEAEEQARTLVAEAQLPMEETAAMVEEAAATMAKPWW